MESQLWNESDWRGKYVGVVPRASKDEAVCGERERERERLKEARTLKAQFFSSVPPRGDSGQRGAGDGLVPPLPSLLPHSHWPLPVQTGGGEAGGAIPCCHGDTAGLCAQKRYGYVNLNNLHSLSLPLSLPRSLLIGEQLPAEAQPLAEEFRASANELVDLLDLNNPSTLKLKVT